MDVHAENYLMYHDCKTYYLLYKFKSYFILLMIHFIDQSYNENVEST